MARWMRVILLDHKRYCLINTNGPRASCLILVTSDLAEGDLGTRLYL